MDEGKAILITTAIWVLITGFLAFNLGKDLSQTEIEERAKNFDKECLTSQELEVIIFGEIQE